MLKTAENDFFQVSLMNGKFRRAAFNIILLDTEDWSIDAENSALITEINYILKNIQCERNYFK